MKYAIISDIHGNIEALQAVLKDIKKCRVDEIICLGDVVGYGADPNESVEAVRQAAARVVAGNHDWAAVGKLGLDYFNAAAKRAAEWTAEVLTAENREYLIGLPLSIAENDDLLMVHSSPGVPEDWMYVFHPGQAVREFETFGEPVCFIGHTHQPAVFSDDGGFHLGGELVDFRMRVGTRYIVNVGSVGQPRDGNPNAAYCVFDSKKLTARILRVKYDVVLSSMKIVQNRLPRSLAERLPLGL